MFPSSRRRSVYPQALRKRVRLFEFILPYMARHQPSRRFGTEALRPLVTVSAGLAVTPILPVAVPVGGSPCRLVFFKTEINVALFDIYESILSEIRTFVRMPSIPYHRLNAPAGDLVAGRRCVVSSVNAHVCGQMLQTLFHIVEDIRHGLDIVDDGRSDAHVDDDVVLAVHRTVLTVVEAVRLPFPVQLSAFGIGHALLDGGHGRLVVIHLLKRLLAQLHTVRCDGFIQLVQIRLRGALDLDG